MSRKLPSRMMRKPNRSLDKTILKSVDLAKQASKRSKRRFLAYLVECIQDIHGVA